MEDIGVTEEMVRFRRYVYLEDETRSPCKNTSVSTYILAVGSQVEGSTTLGMNSDTDMMRVEQYKKLSFHGQITEKTERNTLAAVVVKDKNCCSQCCFLQVRPLNPETNQKIASNDDIDITGRFVCDKQGRIFVSNKPAVDKLSSMVKLFALNCEQHGPAVRFSDKCKETDVSFAIECPSQPDDCQVLFTRPKPGHWPKQQTITDAKQCGIFLVHPGNIGSTYNRLNSILTIQFSTEYSLLQWRISTNTIERLLMFDLSIVQMRAYILTKMIRKEFLGPLEDTRLSTFHMKTSFLFTIEQFPENIWRNDNLLQCVLYCLNTLRRFLKRRYCPHYTIASVNLFENKLEVFEMDLLENEISTMIFSKLICICSIQMDNFGQRMSGRINSRLSTKQEARSLIISQFLFNTYEDWSSNIDRKARKSKSEVDYFLDYRIESESFAITNDDKYRYERKYHLNYILNQKASVEASRCLENNIEISDAIDKMFRGSLSSGKISCYLKYASMLVCTQQYEKAESRLKEVRITKHMVEVSFLLDDFKTLEKRVKFTNSNSPAYIVKDCLRKILTPVSFSREESYCLPKHLVYEMYRYRWDTDANKSEYRELSCERWRDTAVINARPFLFYLQYLSSKHAHTKHVSLCNIEKYLEDKLNGKDNFDKHIETTINILGHIHELENNISAAWTTYAKSVLYVPTNNAALWHLFRLLGQQVYGKQSDTS
ncbi:hypothetical protein DPMN_102877 [Dreissena polymorpha]|uniref:Mab-21-like HhH/H2TH-like domain-containing protein n=1 Tax=Dreissena polymorpha TaxID=45954 RepID=A0A9D4H8U1_DREPO|nr:hypothetical protein DPMN_102877 [Dreissena polymorpha]